MNLSSMIGVTGGESVNESLMVLLGVFREFGGGKLIHSWFLFIICGPLEVSE